MNPLQTELHRLVHQSLWANREWIEFVYTQPDTDTRPKQLVGHIVAGERIWFDRVLNEQRAGEAFPVLGKQELLRDLEATHRIYRELIDGRLEEDIRFTRASGEQYHASVADIIHHLLTHGYHHRGQLAAYYARKGVKYPNTDHIHYLLVNQL